MEPLPTLSLGPFWDDFFAVAPADLAPFPPPAHHPPPSPASAARSLATSSVGRPYTASELVFTNASLRAAGWNDKFPVVDQRKPTVSSLPLSPQIHSNDRRAPMIKLSKLAWQFFRPGVSRLVCDKPQLAPRLSSTTRQRPRPPTPTPTPADLWAKSQRRQSQ